MTSTQTTSVTINFFKVDNCRFVDLPGYGFAKASKSTTNAWDSVMNDYFVENSKLKVVMLLLDSRIPPTDLDKQMLNYFTFNNIPVTIVATKYDKIKKSERMKKVGDIAATLKVGIENIYLISSETAYGKTAIVERLYQFVDGE